jgi:hypothetical protein
MTLTIERTDCTAEIDGVACRLWQGRAANGAECEVFVHRIRVAEDEGPKLQAAAASAGVRVTERPAPQSLQLNLEEGLRDVRDRLIRLWLAHKTVCREQPCHEAANMLAYLAHSLGLGRRQIAKFEQLLVRYDLECQSRDCTLQPAEPVSTEARHERHKDGNQLAADGRARVAAQPGRVRVRD